MSYLPTVTEAAQNEPVPKRKSATVIGAAAYVTGFYIVGLLTVNSYLFHLGTADLSLLKPRFVYTGVLVVLSAVIGPAAIALQWAILKHPAGLPSNAPRPLRRLHSWLRRFGDKPWARVLDRVYSIQSAAMVPLIPFLIFAFFLFLLEGRPLLHAGMLDRESSIRILGRAGALYIGNMIWVIAGFSLMVFIATVTPTHDDPRPEDNPSNMESWFYIPLAALLFVAASMGYIDVFAQNMYPLIPEQFGGGKPRTVRLLFTRDGLVDATQLGIPVTPGRQISDKVAVLFEGDDVYVLRLPDHRIITVTKKLVAGTELSP